MVLMKIFTQAKRTNNELNKISAQNHALTIITSQQRAQDYVLCYKISY